MGFMGLNYPVINTGAALTTIDTFIASTATNSNGTQNLTNGALNTPGAIYMAQPTPFAVAPNGEGSPRFVKYVRYNPTASQTIQAGPSVVYWKDETFTVVTGLASEAFGGATLSLNMIAGWLLPNTTALPGLSTASVLNGNWCFIHVGGFLAGAYMAAAATVGQKITVSASATAFTPTLTAVGTPAALSQVAGYVLTASTAANLSDIYVPFIN